MNSGTNYPQNTMSLPLTFSPLSLQHNNPDSKLWWWASEALVSNRVSHCSEQIRTQLNEWVKQVQVTNQMKPQSRRFEPFVDSTNPTNPTVPPLLILPSSSSFFFSFLPLLWANYLNEAYERALNRDSEALTGVWTVSAKHKTRNVKQVNTRMNQTIPYGAKISKVREA